MDSTVKRHVGVLLHPTSLSTSYGIGDIGPSCHAFVDLLGDSGIDLWQVLPLGPTGFGNSPYASRSAFAGNELLLSPEQLYHQGYLSKQDITDHPLFPSSHVDYQAVEAWKLPLLKKAASNFLKTHDADDDYQRFLSQNRWWLEDYALFMVLYERYQDARWYSMWDEEYAKRDPKAIARFQAEHQRELSIWKALQYFFDKAWMEVKRHANDRGIEIIGDVPIFVAGDSADTWSHLELFQTDKNGRYTQVSGVPPDSFCTTGQLWGNPVYNWDKLKADNYAWWMERLGRLSTLTDYVRIDHFRGFEAYWSVPAQDKTAEHGVWVKAPGMEFFTAVREKFPQLKILAEDLGFMTKEVDDLRDSFAFPGMRIGEFGFNLLPDGRLNSMDTFLPHTYGENVVAYTGTHDNETFRGWFEEQPETLQKHVLEYLGATEENVVDKLIVAILQSHANYAIFPMQDLLGLGNEARMNTPSTCGDFNWSWKLDEEEDIKNRLLTLGKEAALYGRGISWQASSPMPS